MYTTTCTQCQRQFERNEKVSGTMAEALGRNSRSICYGCALMEFTGGRTPEEGDFNSARLVSGEISDNELRWLMEDLRAVEQGRSMVEYPDDEKECIDWCDICGSTCYCNEAPENSDDVEICKGCHREVQDCECLSEDENEPV